MVLDFSYRVIKLNRLNWRDFLRQPNPVAAALMAKMKIAPEDRPKVKLEFLRMIATLRLDIARSELLRDFMDTYLKLSAQEERLLYNPIIEQMNPDEKREIMKVIDQWDAAGIAKGVRQSVLRLLSHRFGPIPAEMADRIAMLDEPAMEELLVAILTFGSLKEVQAWIAAHNERA